MDSLSININNVTIVLHNEININNHLKKISIIGISRESSILKFNNISSGFIFDSLIEEVKLSNLTLYGHLEFNNHTIIEIKNVDLNGAIDINSTLALKDFTQFDDVIKYYGYRDYDEFLEFYHKNLEVNLKLDNFNYTALTSSRDHGINLYGNIEIQNSFFHGNSSCKESIVYYDGENLNTINITNSYFDGEYLNRCLTIKNAYSSNVLSSTFENGTSNKIGGY